MLQITKQIQDNTITYLMDGRLDTNTAPQLEEDLQSVPIQSTLVLDLAKLAYISSAGLRVLLSAQKRMKGIGGMKLIHVVEDVMEIFEVTGFCDILDIEQ